MAGCLTFTGPARAVTEVQEGFDRLWYVANDSLERTRLLLDELKSAVLNLQPIGTDIDIRDAGSLSSPFGIGNPPEVNQIDLTKPTLPNIPDVNNITYTETAQPPGAAPGDPDPMQLPSQPTPVQADQPGPAPEVGTYQMPDAPADEIPPLPTLQPVSIPNFQALELPEVNITLPQPPTEFSFGDFTWNETGYTPEVRNEVVSQIKAILGGSTGIPDPIWDMIENRARKQLRATAKQSREEATDYWASRGHFLSNGQLRKRVDVAGEVEREGVSELVRELVIQDAKIYVDRLNTALAEGIALENQLVALYNAMTERDLKVAQLYFDIRMQHARYKLDVYNMSLQAVQVELQVIQAEIQSELSKLEERKLQLEQQKLIGELNLQELEAYKAQVQGVIAKYDVFTKQVDAVVAQYDADRTRIQAFATEVQAFQALHQAKAVEWQGYGEAVKAELGKQEQYKIRADIFASKVQSYAVGIQADRSRLEAQIQEAKLDLEKARADLAKAQLELEAEVQDTNTKFKLNELEARIYEAAANVEESRVKSDAQRLQVLIENVRSQMNAQVQETQLKIAEAKNVLDAQNNALDTILKVEASISSGAMSALNYAATIASDSSENYGCTTRYTYSGEI